MEEFKSTILVKQVKVLDCTTTVTSSHGHKYSYSKYYEHGNGNYQSVYYPMNTGFLVTGVFL